MEKLINKKVTTIIAILIMTLITLSAVSADDPTDDTQNNQVTPTNQNTNNIVEGHEVTEPDNSQNQVDTEDTVDQNNTPTPPPYEIEEISNKQLYNNDSIDLEINIKSLDNTTDTNITGLILVATCKGIYNSTVENGKSNIVLNHTEFATGINIVDVYYVPHDDIYENVNTTFNVTTYKDTYITITHDDIKLYDTKNITFQLYDSEGNIVNYYILNVSINNYNYLINVENESAVISHRFSNGLVYNITATFVNDLYYNRTCYKNSNVTEIIEVENATPTPPPYEIEEISNKQLYNNDSIDLEINIKSLNNITDTNITGLILVATCKGIYNSTVENGKSNIVLNHTEFATGINIVDVYYLPYDNIYENVNTTFNVTTYKDTYITITHDDIKLYDTKNITFQLYDSEGNILNYYILNVSINDYNYIINVENESAVVTYAFDNSYTYNITATFVNDLFYNKTYYGNSNATELVELDVDEKNLTIEIFIVETTLDNVKVETMVIDYAIKYQVPNATVELLDENGTVLYTKVTNYFGTSKMYPQLDHIGPHNLTIRITPLEGYNQTSTTFILNVTRKPVQIKATTSSSIYQNTRIKVKMIDVYDKYLLVDKRVKVILPDETTLSNITDSEGIADFKLNLEPGKTRVTILFEEDDVYKSQTLTYTVNVRIPQQDTEDGTEVIHTDPIENPTPPVDKPDTPPAPEGTGNGTAGSGNGSGQGNTGGNDSATIGGNGTGNINRPGQDNGTSNINGTNTNTNENSTLVTTNTTNHTSTEINEQINATTPQDENITNNQTITNQTEGNITQEDLTSNETVVQNDTSELIENNTVTNQTENNPDNNTDKTETPPENNDDNNGKEENSKDNDDPEETKPTEPSTNNENNPYVGEDDNKTDPTHTEEITPKPDDNKENDTVQDDNKDDENKTVIPKENNDDDKEKETHNNPFKNDTLEDNDVENTTVVITPTHNDTQEPEKTNETQEVIINPANNTEETKNQTQEINKTTEEVKVPINNTQETKNETEKTNETQEVIIIPANNTQETKNQTQEINKTTEEVKVPINNTQEIKNDTQKDVKEELVNNTVEEKELNNTVKEENTENVTVNNNTVINQTQEPVNVTETEVIENQTIEEIPVEKIEEVEDVDKVIPENQTSTVDDERESVGEDENIAEENKQEHSVGHTTKHEEDENNPSDDVDNPSGSAIDDEYDPREHVGDIEHGSSAVTIESADQSSSSSSHDVSSVGVVGATALVYEVVNKESEDGLITYLNSPFFDVLVIALITVSLIYGYFVRGKLFI